MKRHFLEGVTLVVLAALCAITSNALAMRERKMALVGYYPSAMKVPPQTTEEPKPIAQPAQPAAQPAPTATVPTATQPAAPPRSHEAAPPTPVTAQPRTPVTQPPSSNPATPNVAATYKPHPDKQYIEIPYSDVKALHDSGALFLDARRTSIYEAGHIAGARPFSVWESDIDDKVKKLYDERQDKQADPIVVYCSGGDCEDSHMLAQKLWGVLFNNVYVYKDGFPDWQKHNGAVHTGATP